MSRYSTRDRDRVESNPEAKIYVGELSSAVTKQDLDDTFSYYGPIRTLWVARNPPGFAFIEFEDPRDAEDAVRDTEGRRHYCRRTVCGKPVRIELSNKNYRGKRGSSSSRCYNCDERGHYSKDCRKSRSAPHRSHPKERSRSRSRSRSRHSPSYTRGSRKDDRNARSTSDDQKKPKRHRSPSNSPPPKRRRSSSEGVKYKRKKKSHSSSSFESR